MSLRAIRKLQQEQERQKEIEDDEKTDDLPELEPRKSEIANVFDMLADTNDENEDESDEAPSEANDECNTKESNPNEVEPLSAKAEGKKKRKTRKKKKSKLQSTNNEQNQVQMTGSTSHLDEIDIALKSLSTKAQDGSYAISNMKKDEENIQMWQLLSVDSRQLNALNEMKRLFGNVVLEGDGDGVATPGHNRRRARGPQQLDLSGALAGRNSPASKGQGLAGLALRRNVFMMGKEEWPKATSGGIGMEIVEKIGSGITQYRFVHNSAYQDVQRQFAACVESMESERMINLLQYNRKFQLAFSKSN